MLDGYITTGEAAVALGLSVQRTVALCREKKLPATKVGQAYFIKIEDLAMAENRKPGRPRKEVEGDTKKEPQPA